MIDNWIGGASRRAPSSQPHDVITQYATAGKLPLIFRPTRGRKLSCLEHTHAVIGDLLTKYASTRDLSVTCPLDHGTHLPRRKSTAFYLESEQSDLADYELTTISVKLASSATNH